MQLPPPPIIKVIVMDTQITIEYGSHGPATGMDEASKRNTGSAGNTTGMFGIKTKQAYRWDEPFVSAHFEHAQTVRFKNVPCMACHSYAFCKQVEANPQAYDSKTVSPIRRCTMAAINDGLKEVDWAGKHVLEVGCGDWPYTKDRVEQRGATWIGVDVYKTPLTSAVITGRELPFSNAQFDVVVSNQVLEHVHDAGINPGDLVTEWARVLKPGGRLFANVPIHLHGSRRFRFRDLDALIRMFHAPVFSELEIVYYRRDRGDLAPSRTLIDYGPGGWIEDRYRFVSDEDTWRRLPAKRKFKITLANTFGSLFEFITKIASRNDLGFTVQTENPYARNGYIIDFRCTKRG